MNDKELEYKKQTQGSSSWMYRHGIDFLSQVLWELGHPEEPTETLIEILKAVHRNTDVFITDLDQAATIIANIDEVKFSFFKSHLCTISSRVKAREDRENKKKEKEAASVMPWNK
jgi:hypothetical protein